MQFLCKVGTPGGEVVEQAFAAPSERSLRQDLEGRGYYIFEIRKPFGFARFGVGTKKIPTDTLLVFGQELAALLKAGLPLVQSLDVMLERQRDPLFRGSLEGVRDKVKSGIALSEAFKAEGDLYPPILAASLVAGERSGELETVLRRFAQYLRLNQALRKRAVAAAVYPIMLFVMMGVLIFIMMTRVIPQFQQFYEGMNVKLPAVTRSLMEVAAFVTEHVLVLGLLLAAVIGGIMVYLRQPGSAVAVDRALLRIPYLGHMMRMYATSQLSRTLATLLSGGLPLVQALEVASASIGNRALGVAVATATPQIKEGKSLTAALESSGVLEHLALEMIKVGEQTGALADMLLAVADFYDEDLDTRLQTVLALIEPIMLVLMAVIVAVMLLAFYLPLFDAIGAVETGGPR